MVPGGNLPGLAECRTCHEPIRFVRMALTGKALPVNPRPETGLDAHGTVNARLTAGRLVGYVQSTEHPPRLDHPYRFRPHYATCDRKTTKPAPAPAPTLF